MGQGYIKRRLDAAQQIRAKNRKINAMRETPRITICQDTRTHKILKVGYNRERMSAELIDQGELHWDINEYEVTV